MSVRYYSQYGEDAILWSVFKNQPTGFFIDIGAFDGRYLSNTLSFEEQGWAGLCVEAHPAYIDLCRSCRPRSVCVHAACVAPGGPATTEFFSEPLGILSGVRAYETQDMDKRYAGRNMSFPGFEKIDVTARTLDQIMMEFHPGVSLVDFISVDVEGTEIDVLRGCSIGARVVVVEANTARAKSELTEFMDGRGYVFARSLKQNLFFARDSHTAQILRSAVCDITTELVMHPLGATATHPDHTGKRICLG